MKEKERIIYYEDELKDEFAEDNIVAKKINGDYKYIRRGVWGRISHLFWYRIIATPLAFLYLKVHFHHKIVNKKVLKSVKGQPYFMYGNHTHFMGDALIPTIANLPREVSVIVHPNNVSMPVLGRITPYLGALPLPDDVDAAKHFIHAILNTVNRRKCIMIYPEAHIWPYYTKIRPFYDTSFRYPVTYKTPVFSLTNTYQKRRFRKTPRIVTYLDGPFYPDTSKKAKEQKKDLRDKVYKAMTERALQNNVIMIQYKKKENKEKDIHSRETL